MKTKVTWKESGANARTLKLDDTTRELPEIGGPVEFKGKLYRVTGIESAVVLLEVSGSAPSVTPLEQRNERVEKRLMDEKAFEKHKTVAKFAPAPAKVVSHKKK